MEVKQLIDCPDMIGVVSIITCVWKTRKFRFKGIRRTLKQHVRSLVVLYIFQFRIKYISQLQVYGL